MAALTKNAIAVTVRDRAKTDQNVFLVPQGL